MGPSVTWSSCPGPGLLGAAQQLQVGGALEEARVAILLHQHVDVSLRHIEAARPGLLQTLQDLPYLCVSVLFECPMMPTLASCCLCLRLANSDFSCFTLQREKKEEEQKEETPVLAEWEEGSLFYKAVSSVMPRLSANRARAGVTRIFIALSLEAASQGVEHVCDT
ncbi:hypothetical protein CRUP_032099 [Coryphaenoides rupestris]|nr:hypothetical protein CRUP_032099 [Coryphaenoides rupestris]